MQRLLFFEAAIDATEGTIDHSMLKITTGVAVRNATAA
jgi:hypothetical protein